MHYFISKGGDKKGPLTLDQIKAMSITEDYIIWKEGLSDWVSVKDVPELQELIIKQPPPTPREVEAIQRNDELRLAIKKVLPVFISIYVIFLIIFYSAIGGLTPSDSVLEYLRNQAYPIYYATPGEAYLGLFFIAIFWSLIFSSIASGLYWFASYKPNKKTEFISGSEQGKSINNPYDKIDAQVSGTESQSSNNSDINAIDHKRNNIGKSGIIAAIFLFISIIISAISGYQRENNSTPEAPAEVPAAAPTEETISYEQAIPIDSLQNNSITSSNDLDEREYLIKNLDGVPEKELIQQIDEQIKEKNISTIKDYKEYILSLASKFSNYTVPVINKSTNVTLSLNKALRRI